jgi:hypothetical protein
MKKLTNLYINSESICCAEKMADSSGRSTEQKLLGRASFLDEGANSSDYMSYKGSVEVQLNEEEMIEIGKVAMKALERLSTEVKKSGTDKD